jgi:hypothetical protein
MLEKVTTVTFLKFKMHIFLAYNANIFPDSLTGSLELKLKIHCKNIRNSSARTPLRGLRLGELTTPLAGFCFD